MCLLNCKHHVYVRFSLLHSLHGCVVAIGRLILPGFQVIDCGFIRQRCGLSFSIELQIHACVRCAPPRDMPHVNRVYRSCEAQGIALPCARLKVISTQEFDPFRVQARR